MGSSDFVVTIVHAWSAPRSRSTALLYSWEARDTRNGVDSTAITADSISTPTVALDEPLYRTWLASKITTTDPQAIEGNVVYRPYTDALLTGQPSLQWQKEQHDSDCTYPLLAKGNEFLNALVNNSSLWSREQRPFEQRLASAAETLLRRHQRHDQLHHSSETNDLGVIFCKHMAKHMDCFPWEQPPKNCSLEFQEGDSVNKVSVTYRHSHLLLIRDPTAVLSSWDASSLVHGGNPSSDEVGIIPLLQIFGRCISTSHVAVVDSDDFIHVSPKVVLQRMCAELQVPYTDRMLRWLPVPGTSTTLPKGDVCTYFPHPCDGPWAPWWYHGVWQSIGWDIGDSDRNNQSSVVFRTLPPSLYSTLELSYPAYRTLRTKSSSFMARGPSIHDLYEDPRNAHLLVWIGPPAARMSGNMSGCLVPRVYASLSPWDSSVQGGDACWEGLRVYNGKILSLDAHLKRLMSSAKALGFDLSNTHTVEEIKSAIFQTLAANNMRDECHIRLTLTRGEKYTSSMNPIFNVYGTTLIVLAEWKSTVGRTTYDNSKGISLITSAHRRNSPATLDSKVSGTMNRRSGKNILNHIFITEAHTHILAILVFLTLKHNKSQIHHNNLLNNILAKIQSNTAGVADAIMLDVEGYVAETNATNLFMINENGVLSTPHGDHCLPGITRQTVLDLAAELSIQYEVRRISLAEFHAATEGT
jgi:protein-lysine N-methyltransferase EEF2KMT